MIIYNKYIPFKGFKAMAIFPFIFVRGQRVSARTLRHEKTHFKQQLELLLIAFYLLYFIFYLKYGYRNIPFEREAYDNDKDSLYLDNRKPYAWLKYLKDGK